MTEFGSDEYADYGDYGDETTTGTVESVSLDQSIEGSKIPLASGITSPSNDVDQPTKTADKPNSTKPSRPNHAGNFGSSGNLRPSGNNPSHTNRPQNTVSQQTNKNTPHKFKPAGIAHDDHSFG